MHSADLLMVLVEPVRLHVEALLARRLPAPVVTGAGALLDAAAIAALGVLLAGVARVLSVARTGESNGQVARRVDVALAVGSLGVAAALFAWITHHPSAHFHEVFARGDHLAFAVLAGFVLARAPLSWRPWLVTAVSLAFLCQYCGPRAVAIVLAAGLAGFGALQWPTGRRPWVAVAVQAAIGLVIYGLCWRLRAGPPLVALQTFGLFSFLFLRQISFAVAACQGRAAGISSYLCYLVFYPGATGPLGGPEVWSEFSRRNLGARTMPDYGWGGRKVVYGLAQIWAADRIPISAEAVFASPTAALAWTSSLGLFLQIALRGMGFWAMIDATASFYGFRLRPNFEGILRCRNPSDLWRSWRGTLTNWLICHVYAPLGANRRHQSLNILAAFAVSLVWHWAGVPFLSVDFRLVHLAPITLWAAINAAAVVGHVQMTRHRWQVLPEATPAGVRQGIHVFLTYCLGTLSVTLPSLQLGAQDQFIPFLRRLAGLG